MSESKETRILVDNARSGDEDAVERLILLYHPRLKARLHRQMDHVMRSKIEPDDILQQVYMEAFRALHQFTYQGPDSFLRWLYAILDRKLIDEHRALRAERRDVRREVKPSGRSVNQTTYVDLMARITSGGATPSRVVRRDEAVGVIEACLSRLPEHYREVIQMRFIEGLPVAEVAKQLDRSIGSIHMICHRALRQLREEAEKMGLTLDE